MGSTLYTRKFAVNPPFALTLKFANYTVCIGESMNLSVSILRDELPFKTRLEGHDTGMVLSRYAFWCAGIATSNSTLFLITADDLQEVLREGGAQTFLYVGENKKTFDGEGLPLGKSVLVVLENMSLAELSNAVGAVFERYNKLESTLNQVLRKGSLQELVETMTPFMQNEITIADSNHMMLAQSYNEIKTLARIGAEQTNNNMVPPEVITFFKSNKRWQEVRTYTEPFIYDEGIFNNRLLCVNIINDKEFVCRVMIGETENPFRAYDEDLLVFFSEYVKWLFESTVIVKQVNAVNDLADILLMQISGEHVEEWRLKHALKVKGYKDDSRYQCICIRLSEGDYSANTVQYYCGQINRLFRGVTAFEYGGDLLCLMNLDYYDDSPQTLLAEITPFIRDNNFRAGLSGLFKDMMCFADYHAQAEIALEYGMSQVPSQWIHRYTECAMDCIVWKVSAETNVRAICDEQILALFDYDNANNGRYVKTVESYFRNNMNALATARELGIHRATMIYRLRRIEELSGITFENADKNLLYNFSIKLLKFAGNR